MTTIQFLDPGLCCSTGVCGPELDGEPVRLEPLLRLRGGEIPLRMAIGNA